MTLLTIFYDGTCPLCVKEMRALTKHDQQGVIRTVDIYGNDFAQYPDIDAKKANLILHAVNEKGELLLGLDAAYQAWKLLGRGWLYAPLRWFWLKPIADRGYLWFAKNRYTLSYYLTGTRRCNCNTSSNRD